MRSNPFECCDDDLSLAISRLGRRRGDDGFGNTRAVRVLFEQVRDRQAARIEDERSQGRSPNVFSLSRTDLLGPKITASSLKTSKAWSQLESMEGLLPVKESVQQLFQLVVKNAERELHGKRQYPVVLNRLFLGNPGTGKTTVAKLYGEILADLGLLSKGEVIMKCSSDFVGDVLGSSEKATQAILKSAQGNVLVIDEAYSLYSGSGTTNNNDPYKTAVIDTIVERVPAKPGADIAVILIGYEDEMKLMMSKVNPGLSRRFQLESSFYFPDFDDAALCRIMMSSAREQQVTLKLAVAKRAVRMLAKARAKPSFGNAGSVNNLLAKAIIRMQARDKATELVPDVFGYSGDGLDDASLDKLFNGLVGCDEIKVTMEELRATVEFSIAQGKEASSGVSFNYLFLGNPGTGKTTVARRMGRMFHALGLLPTDELKEAKASDLVTGYAQQAAKQTRDILRDSRGGVLFIDEAYQLNPARGGPYMSEAVDELVGALTEEEFKGKLLVILAGYDADMETMLKINPGLQSRFTERVHFRDFDAPIVVNLLRLELKKLDIPLTVGDNATPLVSMANKLIASDNFGNGRDVVTWAKRVYGIVARHFKAKKSTGVGPQTMNASIEDVEEALHDVLESRKLRLGGQQCSEIGVFDKNAMKTEGAQVQPPKLKTAEAAVVGKGLINESGESAIVEELCDPFRNMDKAILGTLQNCIDDQDLGSEEGTQLLKKMDQSSPEYEEIVARLQSDLNMTRSGAIAKLEEWKLCQKHLEETLQEEKKKTQTLGVRPIWRCGVCGRADKPWIACFVAPFIVRYEKIPVDAE